MSIKDWITVSISILALLVSSTTAYFNFFRIRNDASAAVLGLTEAFDDGRPGIELDIAVYNTGNRQIAVTRIEILVNTNLPTTTLVGSEDPKFPVLVEPKEVRLFKVRANDVAWLEITSNKNPSEPNEDCPFETPVGFDISAVSATGSSMRVFVEEAVRFCVGDATEPDFFSGYEFSPAPIKFDVYDYSPPPVETDRP